MNTLLRIFALLLLMLFPWTSGLAAGENNPDISDILITTSQSHLLLFCTINNSFTPDMIEGVHNGIPVTFTFFIELDKKINAWPDSTLADISIQHTLSYDSLKEKYQVLLPERSKEKVVTDSLEKAIELMSELNGIKIIKRDQLVPDAPYALHVKTILAEKTLPMNMHYIIPFISLWDFETDWRTIEFRY